jgi:putative FmdB family regulatory protein
MPIYEYRRQDGSTFEVMQKFSDDPLTADPATGQPVQRVLHAPAIHFKGKGFHNTDYGTRKRRAELEKSASDGADKTEAKAKEKTSESKSDSSSSSSDAPKAEVKKDKKAA